MPKKHAYLKEPRKFVREFIESYRKSGSSPQIPDVYAAGKRMGYEREKIRIGLIEHMSGERFKPSLHLS